jgi:hypothetical protein
MMLDFPGTGDRAPKGKGRRLLYTACKRSFIENKQYGN